MELTPQDAEAALAEVERARATMRQVIRSHRGHHHLWIWGLVWIIMPLTAFFCGDQAVRYFGLMCIPGAIASVVVGLRQGRQITAGPGAGRVLTAIAALLVFGAAFPFVLHASSNPRGLYAYSCLVAMQSYVVAGLWTDTYLLRLGLFVSVLILIGYFWLPGIFWLWMAVCGGGSLLASGFYVRHAWR
jgi:hypothetical protein